jgi:two-component system cell cycle response regulator
MSGKILIIDSNAHRRSALSQAIQNSLYSCTAAKDIETAEYDGVEGVLLSANTPDTIAKIRAQLHDANCPILVLCHSNAGDDRAGYFRAGAADLVETTCDLREILSRLRSAMRRATAAREVALRSGTTRALGFAEANSTFAAKQMIHVLQMTGTTPPVVTLRDFAVQSVAFDDLGALGERQALKCLIIDVDRNTPRRVIPLLLDLRAHPATRYSSLILRADGDIIEHIGEALDCGADDIVTTHMSDAELYQRIQIHQDHLRTNAILRESSIIGLNAAVTDPLTGLFNRRYAQSHINLLLEDARSNGGSVTALMVDIDHFKSINDAHGHFIGDQVICSVAHTLKSAIRASDLVARFGGEEFVVILPNITPKDANTLAQRLRRKDSEIVTDATPMTITISIGISRFDTAELFESGLENYDQLLKEADEALYHAKRAGRNCVAYYSH